MAEHITLSEEETRHLAAQLAHTARPGDIFALRGDLGAGKSAFSRGFIQALLGDIDVPSPTFTLIQTYESDIAPVHHFDLYRLEDPQEVLELGWDDALAGGICLIEWPDKAGGFLPARARSILFTVLSPDSRKIVIDDPGSR